MASVQRKNGLTYIAILVEVIIGKQAVGPSSDYIMEKHAKSASLNGQPIRLEHRFKALFVGYVLVPIGLIIFGVSLQEKTH